MDAKRREIEGVFLQKNQQLLQLIKEEEQKTVASLQNLFANHQQMFLQKNFFQSQLGREKIQDFVKQIQEGLKQVELIKNNEEIAKKIEILKNLGQQKLKQTLQTLFKEQKHFKGSHLQGLIKDYLQEINFDFKVPEPIRIQILFPDETENPKLSQEIVRSLPENEKIRAMDIGDDKMMEFKSFGQENSNKGNDMKSERTNIVYSKIAIRDKVPVLDHKQIIPKTVNP